ncbi:MAG: Holliday junction branch migration protein RuvA [Lachnospiraceae bacterium]|nr:Holliday junction branch migration protein RuvA [Lachnospiraceae bacterium]
MDVGIRTVRYFSMIAMLQGRLEERGATGAVIMVGGVGYEVLMPASELALLPAVGEEVRVYTHLSVNENTGITLFAFLSQETLAMFRKLITVSGVGPKGALAVLSVLPASDLTVAIMTGDEAAIAKAPGLGKKTAAKIILDLRDKVSWMPGTDVGAKTSAPETVSGGSASEDAIEALIAIGYSRSDAAKAVAKVENKSELDADDIFTRSLRYL